MTYVHVFNLYFQITLAGQSAGGVSASYHILSPKSDNLFHSAIIQSGIFTVPYPRVDKHPAFYARTLAEAVGCDPVASSDGLFQCLSSADAADLVLKATQLFDSPYFEAFPFKPHLDNGTAEPFLAQDPWETLQSGNFQSVPVIFGYNEYDNILFISKFFAKPDLLEEIHEKFEDILAHVMFQR